MKNGKFTQLLDTPLSLTIMLGALVLGVEYLFMRLLHEVLIPMLLLSEYAWDAIDAVTLCALVSPMLYISFRKLRKQQTEIEDAHKRIGQAFQEWIVAMDAVNDPIFLHDQQFRILRCNRAYQRCAGLPFKQIIGQPYYTIFPKNHAPLPSCQRAMEKAEEEEEEEEEEEVAVGETIYRSRAFSIKDEQGAYLYSVHTLEDITERKQMETALRTSHQRFEEALEATSDGIWEWNIETNAEFFAPRWCEILGYSYDDPALPHTYESWASRIHPEDSERVSAALKAHLEEGKPYDVEYRHLHKSGEYRWQNSKGISFRDHAGKPIRMIGAIRDITERKRVENELRLRAQLLDSTNDSVFVHDFDGNFVYLNESAWRSRGYTRDELMGMNLHVLDVPEYEKLIEPRVRELVEKGQCFFESAHRRKDGSVMPIEVSARIIESGGRKLVLSAVRDITERKQGEKDIQHANRALATLSAVNRNLVRATNEDELLQAICDAIVKQRGFRLAWVGYKQHDESKSIKIMARAGHDEGYLDTAQISWAETEPSMKPCGYAIRSGATYVCQDITNDPHYLPWREAALQRGYAASIALPLLNGDGMVFGILNVYAAETNAFTPNEVDLLEEMAGDLAFGVLSLHTRHQRDLAMEQNQRHLEKLRSSLEDTVRAMAGLVEMRDPYTAGHQARVANLAAAIARQMGLPDEQAHAIHIAGTVHDLGKINIPAEVLSKPGKITAIEFNLIKTHPQAGYDILQGIDFPWPIAQMVLQHHERLDGSGYPQGLKGEAILLEARILAVADVVEAISAHRPYRPGFGIDIALAEITKNRGNYYAPQVVDACLALFREQHYSFKS